jgi:hypothetical protein
MPGYLVTLVRVILAAGVSGYSIPTNMNRRLLKKDTFQHLAYLHRQLIGGCGWVARARDIQTVSRTDIGYLIWS